MGYVVRKLTAKKRAWKLQYVTYAGGVQKIRDIPETEYARLGFVASMSLLEAQGRRDQLNAQGHLQRTEEKRLEISKRLQKEERVLDAFLDARDVREFEEQVLFAGIGAEEFVKRNKMDSHWRKARKILTRLKLEPQDWDFQKRRFYEVFTADKMSPSYTKKVIGILNLWGRFHCRKYGKYFEPLSFPGGREKERISDAYYDKAGQGRVSDPITPAQLERQRLSMRVEWYNWFYLSIWFGLRPWEVDSLKKPSGPRTWYAGVKDGVPFLAVYQTKLVGIPREKRTKMIPCIVPEQVAGLKLIERGNFKRPSHSRHIKKWFSESTTLYGGRKGFSDLMRSLGQSMEDYHVWMGHQTIERTFRDYKDKQTIHFNPVTRSREQVSKRHDYSTLDFDDAPAKPLPLSRKAKPANPKRSRS